MKYIVGILLILIVIFFSYPLLNEDTSNTCSAVEKRLIKTLNPKDLSSVIILNSFQNFVSNGNFVSAAVQQYNPNIPPFMSCDLAYWRMLLDPHAAEQM